VLVVIVRYPPPRNRFSDEFSDEQVAEIQDLVDAPWHATPPAKPNPVGQVTAPVARQ
jgi:hypothetical protein